MAFDFNSFATGQPRPGQPSYDIFQTGNYAADNSGNYYGTDPLTGQRSQIFWDAPQNLPGYVAPYEGGGGYIANPDGSMANNQGGGYWFADDPNRPQTATQPWTHSDPSGFGWNLLSKGVPIGLGLMAGGAGGLFGAGGSAVGSGAVASATPGVGAPEIAGIASGADPFVTAGGGALMGAPGAATAGAGVAGGSGGLLDWLGTTLGGGGGGAAAGAAGSNLGQNLMLAGGNALINGYLSNRARQQAQNAADRSNPLAQPQRAPFQAAANDLIQNPQSYFQNNPFATSMANFYKNSVIPANIAKSGNTGFETDRLGAQFATALGSNYNDLASVLAGYGGYNQGPGYSGTNYLAGNTASNQYLGEAARGFGNLIAQNNPFGNPTQPKTPQVNPTTGSYQVMS